VTLVRSPTLTNSESLPTLNGSRPDRRSFFSTSGHAPRLDAGDALAIAAMCSGEVPQQPPTMFTKPCLAQSATSAASCSGVSS
jgi:hypothetical protein